MENISQGILDWMEETASSSLGVNPSRILLFLDKQTRNFIYPLTAASVKQYENISVT